MLSKSDIRRIVRDTGMPSDDETLYVWFHVLYERDFDHDEDGMFTGADTAHNHTLLTAVKQGLR